MEEDLDFLQISQEELDSQSVKERKKDESDDVEVEESLVEETESSDQEDDGEEFQSDHDTESEEESQGEPYEQEVSISVGAREINKGIFHQEHSREEKTQGKEFLIFKRISVPNLLTMVMIINTSNIRKQMIRI